MTNPTRNSTRILARSGLLAAGLLIAIGAGLAISHSSAEEARVVPAPAIDEAAGSAKTETAVLAGGCFWGVQGVFQHVKGVSNAVSGYAGGDESTADYETVGTGTTGHAELVRVTFDPSQISYGRLLQVYLLRRPRPDRAQSAGPGRRHPIPLDDLSRQCRTGADRQGLYRAAERGACLRCGRSSPRSNPIAPSYPAEDYHQDFLSLHPTYPYIVYNDLPKIADLKNLFPDLYRDKPILVAEVHE